ncbi:MAG: FAD-dependent oxidoreductase [Desulfosarcinaceae bacterium]
MTKDYDQIIIGAGITGASIAFELSKKGYKSLVVDKLPAAGCGSTSSTCAIIRTHYSTLEGTAVAYESWFYWRNWASYLNMEPSKDLARFIQTGAVILNKKDFDWSKYLKHHDALNIPYETWTTGQLLERMPHFVDDSYFPPKRPEDPDFYKPPAEKIHPVVLFFPNNGYINDPQLSVENVQEAGESKGATFLFNAEVTEIRKQAGRVAGITLSGGQAYDAPVVVNAAGPHSFVVNRLAGIADKMKIKTKALRHEVHFVPSPEGFSYEDEGITVGDGDLAGYHRPETGNMILVGSEDPECDRPDWVDDPDHFNRDVTDAQWKAQVYRLALRMPGLSIPNRPKGIADLYDVSDDWIPIYDKSDLGGYYLAIGTSGNQYKNGPVIGKIMARIIEACENGHDHDQEPVTIQLKHTGFTLNTGFFSRNRDIVGDSSFSVLG